MSSKLNFATTSTGALLLRHLKTNEFVLVEVVKTLIYHHQ